jgi:UTP--glucose-1-phosphate uridylyltransferase
MKIEHLVIPMAGLGKRLRPLTLYKPKSLVEVNGLPLLHYILMETVGTDIKHAICIISAQHEEQFREYFLSVQAEFPDLTFHIRIQEDPIGNGHAVLLARDIVGDKPFAVRFPDDILVHNPPALHSLIALYSELKAPVLLLERVPKEVVSNYGVVVVGEGKEAEGGKVYEIKGIVEKPPIEEAPSDLTVVGGYVLDSKVMDILSAIFAALPEVRDDALLLVAAFEELIAGSLPIYGWQFPGTRLDCGTIAGFERADAFLKEQAKS